MRKQREKKSPATDPANGGKKENVQKKIKITAARDAYMPDGSFVKKGSIVEVDEQFVARLNSEKDRTFII